MNTLVVFLICLIVLPVIVTNAELLPTVFATNDGEDTEENSGQDTEDTEEIPDEEGSGGLASKNEGDDEETDPELTDDSADLSDNAEFASPETPTVNMPGPSAALGDSNRNGDSEQDGGNNDRFRHNAQEIAMELTSLSPEELREYPITDLSEKDITQVFRFLAPENLAKVLLNIHQESLVEIQERLTPADFGESLSRISAADRTQIADRLVLTSKD